MAQDNNAAVGAQSWKPSTQTMHYDRVRVEELLPIKAALDNLELPLIRLRKLRGIVNALEMQIEDWGDSPEVNRLLLDALQAALHYQVTEQQARPVLQAIENFQQQETHRWEQVRVGKPPPILLTPIEALDELIYQGNQLLNATRPTEASDLWLQAWEWIKQLAQPEMKTLRDFVNHFRSELDPCIFNWLWDFSRALNIAGTTVLPYHEHRLRFVREYLELFTGESVQTQIHLQSDKAQSLLALGRKSEAEAVLTALVERFPDHAWAYIGWSDLYWFYRDSPGDYTRAEQILRLALDRQDLRNRDAILSRMEQLNEERQRPQPATPKPPVAKLASSPPSTPSPLAAASRGKSPTRKVGRNNPCWCGSGKKYKNCHLDKDRV